MGPLSQGGPAPFAFCQPFASVNLGNTLAADRQQKFFEIRPRNRLKCDTKLPI
jgi:hypothetical protein